MLLATPATAEPVPPHLAKFAATLLRGVEPRLGQSLGDPSRDAAMAELIAAAEAQGMFRWAGGALERKGAAAAIGEALGLGALGIEEQALIDAVLTGERAGEPGPALIALFKARGKPAPEGAALDQAIVKLREAVAAQTQGLGTRHEQVLADGRQQFRIDWNPNTGRVAIELRDTGDATHPPFRSRIEGKAEARVDAEGDLAIAVAPAEAPLQAASAEDLENEFNAIFGEWQDQEGERWVIAMADGAEPRDPVAARKAEQAAARQAEIEKRRAAVAELKAAQTAAKVFVWINEDTGEEVRQTKFKRLDEPYRYQGQVNGEPGEAAEIARLEAEIAELERAEAAAAEVARAIGQPPPSSARGAPDGKAIRITHHSEKGYVRDFVEAWYSGDGIDARRTMIDIRELNQELPDSVRQQLLADGWDPPEWLELRVTRGADGVPRLEGANWFLHVAYSGLFGAPLYEISGIENPYSRPLVLTRSREPQGPSLRFVIAEGGGFRVLDSDLPYGEPIFLEALYPDAQDEAEKTVDLAWPGGAVPVPVTRTSDPKLYRSASILLEPPAAGGDEVEP